MMKSRLFGRIPERIVLSSLFVLVMVTGCSNASTPVTQPVPANAPAAENAVQDAPLNLGPDVTVQTVAEVKDRDDVLVLDVREDWEYNEKHIPGVLWMPMNTVSNRLSEIPKDKEVIVTCRSGNRSGQVVDFLRQQGFTNVHNMTGGIVAWESAGLPVDR